MSNIKSNHFYGFYLFLTLFCVKASALDLVSQSESQSPESYRLWCSSPEGYYPQVSACNVAWVRLRHVPKSDEVRPPHLLIPVAPPAGSKELK